MFVDYLLSIATVIVPAASVVFAAFYHPRWATKSTRKRTTFDTLNKKQWDKDYILCRKIFFNATEKSPNSLLDEINKEKKETRKQSMVSVETATRLIMNDYELMFIAIETGILDENIIKSWRKSSIIRDYQRTKAFVEWIRAENNNNKIYEIFQKYARSWAEES